MNQRRNGTRRIWVLLGLGAALALAPVGTTAQAMAFTDKPILREVWVNLAAGQDSTQLDVEFEPQAHIPRLPE